jgi:LCP family protein required for cell wall assembly
VVDGRDRTPRRGGTDVHRESVEEILARNRAGSASGPHAAGGRAARRRAAEERSERDAAAAQDPPPRRGGRHAAPAEAPPAAPGPPAPPPAPPAWGGPRPDDGLSRAAAAGASTGAWTPAGPPGDDPGRWDVGGPDAGRPRNGAERPSDAPSGGRHGGPTGSAPFGGPPPAPDRPPAFPDAPGRRAAPDAPPPGGRWNAPPAPPPGPYAGPRNGAPPVADPAARPGRAPAGYGPGAPRPPGPDGTPHGPGRPTSVFDAAGSAAPPHGRPAAPPPGARRPPEPAPGPWTGAVPDSPAGWPPPPHGGPPPSPPHGAPPARPQGGPAAVGLPAPRRPGQQSGPTPAADPATAEPAPSEAATTALPARRARPDADGPGATEVVRLPAADEPSADEKTQLTPTGADDSTRVTRRPADRATRESEREMAASRIDESLVRMTAAHAGLDLSRSADDAADEPEPAPPVPRRRRAGRLAVRLLVAAVALLVLAAGGVGWGSERWLDAGIRDAAAVDLDDPAIVDAVAQRGDRNVLVVASDRSRDPADRADTVAVAHVPADGGPVVVLSVPHNLEIDRPSCERWDPATAGYDVRTERAEANTQLVSALDVGGPRCLTAVVQQLTGLAITGYVGLDLGAVEGLAAAVQGVEVCVPAPVVDGALGTIVPDPGTSRLDGVRVADFVRARDVAGDPASESARIERQQRVLTAVLDRVLDERSLLDVGRVQQLRPALREALVVDGGGLDEVLAVSRTLRRLDAPGVVFAVTPTSGGTDGVGNALLRDTDAAAVFGAVREGRDLPEQADDPLEAVAGPAPADVRVQLLNASGAAGLADQVGGALGALGFGVGEVGNAEQPTNETIIKFSPDQAAGAALLASSVPSATSVPDPGSSGVLQLVLGRSFDEVVQPPAASGPVDPGAAALDPSVPRASCP